MGRGSSDLITVLTLNLQAMDNLRELRFWASSVKHSHQVVNFKFCIFGSNLFKTSIRRFRSIRIDNDAMNQNDSERAVYDRYTNIRSCNCKNPNIRIYAMFYGWTSRQIVLTSRIRHKITNRILKSCDHYIVVHFRVGNIFP